MTRSRLPLILACAALLPAGIGCGSDDSEHSAPGPCEGQAASPPPGRDAEAARQAVIAYFVTCDPAACKQDVTERHIRLDYDGDLARCEEVRRNNGLIRDDFTVAGDPQVEGKQAQVKGRVTVTGQKFFVRLKLVDGAWKIDRLRGAPAQ